METTELRPLSLGELLDRTFTLYRRHFWLFVGIMAIPSAFSVPFNIEFLSMRSSKTGAPSPTLVTGAVLLVLVFFCIYWILYSLAIGATTFAVSETYLGRQATVRGAYRKVRNKLWGIIGLISSVTLRMMGIGIIGIIGVAILIALTAALAVPFRGAGAAGRVIVAVGIGLAYLGLMAFLMFWALRYAVSISALLLEKVSVREAIHRSVELTKGRRGQIFVAVLLSLIVGYAGVIVFQGPFLLARAISRPGGQQAAWITFSSSVLGAVGGAITMPLLMIVLVLCYYDTRIRREAFDLEFMMSSLDQSVPTQRTQGAVSPV
jgi:hypothetical protein